MNRVWWAPAIVAALAFSCADDLDGPAGETQATGGYTGGDAGGAPTGGMGGMVPAEEDPFEPPPAVEPLPADALEAMGASIDGILGGFSGQSHSVLVVGAETGQVVYERDPDRLLKPASNTKLFSSAAAMVALGDEHRSETVVYATAAPSGGVVNGDIVLVADHDFTWTTRFYPDARFPLRQLADALAEQGIEQVTGNAQVRGEPLYEGYNFGTYNPVTERAATATQWGSALASAGIGYQGTSTSAAMDPPPGAIELARWKSLPLDVASSPLNRISHNEFADILSRHLGWEVHGDSSYAGGEKEMIALLDTAPMDAGGVGSGMLDNSGIVFNDGSGLSHGNRVSARHIVALMHLMEGRSEGLAWERTFTIAGIHGTIGGRLGGANTVGRFFGKTGTLNDTIALSGILEHRYDGQRYHIAMLMNGVGSSSAARAAHDQIVSVVAEERREASDVPPAPILLSLHNDANEQTVTATWSPVPDIDGYLVWRSRDGATWARSDARFVQPERHRTLSFEDTDRMFIRVTAVRGIFESDPSDVYGAGLAATPSGVLLVDGNDRWQEQPSPENVRGLGHDFMVRYGEAIVGRGYDTCPNESVLDGTCLIDDYSIVVWALGEESVDHLALAPEEQTMLRGYTESGGALLISGAELGYQLAASMAGLTFMEDVLHVGYRDDDAGTSLVRIAGESAASVQVLSFLTPDQMVIGYPDQLEPVAGAIARFDYIGGIGGVAGIQYDAGYRAITFGFPVEAIDNRVDREALLTSALSFLDGN